MLPRFQHVYSPFVLLPCSYTIESDIRCIQGLVSHLNLWGTIRKEKISFRWVFWVGSCKLGLLMATRKSYSVNEANIAEILEREGESGRGWFPRWQSLSPWIQLCLETAMPRDWQEKESWINNFLSFLHLQNFEILMGKTCPATMVPTSVHCAKQVLNIFYKRNVYSAKCWFFMCTFNRYSVLYHINLDGISMVMTKHMSTVISFVMNLW